MTSKNLQIQEIATSKQTTVFGNTGIFKKLLNHHDVFSLQIFQIAYNFV